MTRTLTRRLATSFLVGIALTGMAAAQQPSSQGLLTGAQVRDLAAKASTPAEHAQLRDHFTTLAARYEADAKRHAALSKLPGSPRQIVNAYATHHTRLLQAVSDTAKSARELADFHGKLATGQPATRPADPAHLEHGTGAPTVLSDAQLQQLVTGARTPGDHGKLVEYFNSLAAKYSQDADAHATMAGGYRGHPRGMTSAVDHCERIVKQARTAAAEAKALAAEHQAMAK